jgi:hypothetical protein
MPIEAPDTLATDELRASPGGDQGPRRSRIRGEAAATPCPYCLKGAATTRRVASEDLQIVET